MQFQMKLLKIEQNQKRISKIYTNLKNKTSKFSKAEFFK